MPRSARISTSLRSQFILSLFFSNRGVSVEIFESHQLAYHAKVEYVLVHLSLKNPIATLRTSIKVQYRSL